MIVPVEYTLKGVGILDIMTMWWSRKGECYLNGHPKIVDGAGNKLYRCSFCDEVIHENLVSFGEITGKSPIVIVGLAGRRINIIEGR